MPDDRLSQQLAFIREIDKLKQVFRQSYLLDASRKENDAEHSWHLAVMAMLLREYADPALDLLRVMQMVLVHDVVEIDAGDVFMYDAAGQAEKAAHEAAAAARLFALLPAEQAAALRALWDEFETVRTPEARYANALDRLEPLLLNYHTQGKSWREHAVTADHVRAKNLPVFQACSPTLTRFAEQLIDDAVARGYLAAGMDE